MSELVDKQVNVQKESLKKLPGFTQNSRKPTQNSRQPTKKCAMKMKQRNKQRKKNDGRLKYFLMEEGVYKFVRKTRTMDIKQLQINDSSYIEGTICLVNE